jgi:hypothetical protein
VAAAAERRLRLLQGQAVDRRHDGPAHLGDQHGGQEQACLQSSMPISAMASAGTQPGRLGIRDGPAKRQIAA